MYDNSVYPLGSSIQTHCTIWDHCWYNIVNSPKRLGSTYEFGPAPRETIDLQSDVSLVHSLYLPPHHKRKGFKCLQ